MSIFDETDEIVTTFFTAADEFIEKEKAKVEE
jgi:hypothetical protein